LKLTDQRLEQIVESLHGRGANAAVTTKEWASMALELRQLRLRTSSQTRVALAAASASTGARHST
jgi:hypothetical protein